MPNVNSYILKSYNGGLSDYDNKGIQGSFKFGKNLNIRKKQDTLSCQQALADDLASGTFDDDCHFIITASDGYTYFFLDNGKIYRRDPADSSYTLVYTDTAGASDGGIVGAYEWVNDQDMVFLYWASKTRLNRKRIINAGTPDDTDWTVAPLVNATLNGQTYPKTNLTSADWHTMRDVNGVLLIANGNTIAQVGYDDSYTNNALQLIPGNIAKTLIERDQYGAFGCTREDNREESNLFIWDGLSTAWNGKKKIPSSSVNALVDIEVPLMQVGTDGLVYYADNVSVLPIFTFPEGGQVNPEGVDVDDGLALFGVYGNGDGYSGIYSYGRKTKNNPIALNLEYQFDCDEIGAVKKIGSDILFTYRDGSNYGVKIVDTTTKATAVYESLELEAPFTTLKVPSWMYLKISMDSLPTGTSISVKRRINRTGDFVACNLENGETSYSTENGEEAVFNIGDTGKVAEIQITLTPYGNNSPEIRKAELMFAT